MEMPNEKDFIDKLEKAILEVDAKCNYFVPQFIIKQWEKSEQKNADDKSLNKINPTIQGKMIFDNNSMFKKTTKLVITKILSARGSIKIPNFDTT